MLGHAHYGIVTMERDSFLESFELIELYMFNAGGQGGVRKNGGGLRYLQELILSVAGLGLVPILAIGLASGQFTPLVKYP